MMKRSTLDQYCDDNDVTMKVLDGFDDAIVGFATQAHKDPVAVYSYAKVIALLERDMSREDAVEYFDFNIAGSFVGEDTPMILYTENDVADGDGIYSDGATA